MTRPNVLAISGFDPTGGAGILADIKTFEQNGVYGFGICSALTDQTDEKFYGVEWCSTVDILRQIDHLMSRYKITGIKIGIISNFDALQKVVAAVRSKAPDIFIAWDPVLSSSTGFDFHTELSPESVMDIFARINLITPNIKEALLLSRCDCIESAIKFFSGDTFTLIKSAKSNDATVTDILVRGDEILQFSNSRLELKKHGTGCILASAIVAGIALSDTVPDAVVRGQKYVAQVLESNDTLLGYHTS